MITLIWLSAALASAAQVEAPDPQRHTVAAGECLWDLAGRYYGNHFLWRVIAEANPDIKDPNLIVPGQVLSIPAAPRPAPVEAAAPVEPPAAPEPTEASSPVELPAQAQPEEASAPMESPEPEGVVEAAAPEPVAEPAPAAPPPAPVPAPARPEVPDIGRDTLSTTMPEAQTGQYPSLTRLKAPAGWREDGRVAGFEGEDVVAGPGDLVEARLSKGLTAREGERFHVLRQDAPRESDDDPKAVYLQRVGIVEVRKVMGKGLIRCRILRSGGAVSTDDLLSRREL